MPYRAKATPRFSGGKESLRIAWAIGCKPPPPMPCSARKKSKTGRLGASPQSRELTVKIESDSMKYFLRPIISASQPLMGRMMALAAR